MHIEFKFAGKNQYIFRKREDIIDLLAYAGGIFAGLTPVAYLLLLFYNKHKQELLIAESTIKEDSFGQPISSYTYNYLTFLKYTVFLLLTEVFSLNLKWQK